MFYTPLLFYFFPSSPQPAFLFLELFCNLTRFAQINCHIFHFIPPYGICFFISLLHVLTCFIYTIIQQNRLLVLVGGMVVVERKPAFFFRSSGYSHFYQLPILMLHLPRCPPDIIQSNAGVGNKVHFFFFFSLSLQISISCNNTLYIHTYIISTQIKKKNVCDDDRTASCF